MLSNLTSLGHGITGKRIAYSRRHANAARKGSDVLPNRAEKDLVNRAMADCNKAIEMDQRNSLAWTNRGLACIELWDKKPDVKTGLYACSSLDPGAVTAKAKIDNLRFNDLLLQAYFEGHLVQPTGLARAKAPEDLIPDQTYRVEAREMVKKDGTVALDRKGNARQTFVIADTDGNEVSAGAYAESRPFIGLDLVYLGAIPTLELEDPGTYKHRVTQVFQVTTPRRIQDRSLYFEKAGWQGPEEQSHRRPSERIENPRNGTVREPRNN